MNAEFLHKDKAGFVVRVQLSVYGLEPLQTTVHKFTDRAFVHLERIDDDVVLCRFQQRRSLDNLAQVAGEFLNELLDQSLRWQLAQKTEPIRKLLIAQAFSQTNLFHPELDSANAAEDELSIGTPDSTT
jgi:His-Xaa-Ser system protein HxsD